MANARDGARRSGPVERAAAAVPPPGGRAFRWIILTLLAVSTAALIAIAAQLFLVLQSMHGASDVAALKSDVAGLKTEVAGFRGEVQKALAMLQKSSAETADGVNTANLALNNMALGLAKKP